MAVKGKLFPPDEKECYFHLYYSEGVRASRRDHFEEKIDRMGEALKKQEGTEYICPAGITKYFNPIYHTGGIQKPLWQQGRKRKRLTARPG